MKTNEVKTQEVKELEKKIMDKIDEMVKTSKSMMPKALLDRFTKDEIFELMAFLISLSPPAP